MAGDPLKPEDFTALLDQPQEAGGAISPDEFTSLLDAPATPEKPSLLGAAGAGLLETPKDVADIAGTTLGYMADVHPQSYGSRGPLPSWGPSGRPPPRSLPDTSNPIVEGIAGLQEKIYPEATRGKGGLLEQLAFGGGNVVGALPFMAAGPGAASVAFGAQTAMPLYHDVLHATGDKEAATWAMLFGFGVGQLEHLGGAQKSLEPLVKKLSEKQVAGALEKAVLTHALVGGVKGAATEAATSAAQQGLQDAILEHFTDEDVANWDRVVQQLPASLIMGGAAGLVGHAFEAVKARKIVKGTSAAEGAIQGSSQNVEQGGLEGEAPPVAEKAPESLSLPSERNPEVKLRTLEEARAAEGMASPAEAPPVEQPGTVEAQPGAVSEPAAAVPETQRGANMRTTNGERNVSAMRSGSAPDAPLLPNVQEGIGPGAPSTQAETDVSAQGRPVREVPEAAQRRSVPAVPDVSQGRADRPETSKANGEGARQERYAKENEPHGAQRQAQADAVRGVQGGVSRSAPRGLQRSESGDLALRETSSRGASENRANAEVAPAEPLSVEEETRGPDLPEPPAAKTAETPEPEKTIGIKNKTMAKELEDMGLPTPEKSLSKKDVELHAQAKEVFEKSQGRAGEELVNELERNPRPTNDAEGALLTFEANRLADARDKAEAAFVEEPSEENRAKVEATKAAFKRAADIFEKVGREHGRGFRARQLMLARDYSLAAMERAAAVAKHGELNAEESARIKELHEKIAKTTKAHEDYVAAAEKRRAEDEAEKALLRLKAEAGKSPKRAARAKAIEQAKKEIERLSAELKEHTSTHLFAGPDTKSLVLMTRLAAKHIEIGVRNFATWAEDMVAKFGEHVRPHLRVAWENAQGERRETLAASLQGKSPEAIHRGVQKIALGLVESGIKDRHELVKAVHEVMADTHPDMALEDTRDAISGYGIFRKLTPGEARAQLRDLKGQMQQVAKLEALQARQRPAKTGFERQPASPEQARLAKQVRDLQRQFGLTAKPDRLKALKARLQNQITDIEARIKAKDFAPKAKPAPVTPDAEAVNLQLKKEEALRQFEKEKRDFEYANRTKAQRIWDAVTAPLKVHRALRAAFDDSAVFVQGAFHTFAHPIKSAGYIGKSLRAMKSESYARLVDARDVRGDPLYPAAKNHGKVEFSSLDEGLEPTEELFASNLMKKLPVVGHGLEASRRGMVTLLNLYRMNMFRAMAAGIDMPTPHELRVIGKATNVFTGRGNVGDPSGKLSRGMDLLALGIWSPRNWLAKLQTVVAQPAWRGTRRTRVAVAKQYARAMLGVGAFYMMKAVYDDAMGDEEEGPLSTKFAKPKVGDTYLDPYGGITQILTLASRLYTGEKKTTAGKEVPIRGEKVPYGGDRPSDLLWEQVRNKMAPAPSLFLDALNGEGRFGEELNAEYWIKNGLAPITLANIYDALRHEGAGKGTAISLATFFGIGANDYGASEPKKGKKKSSR